MDIANFPVLGLLFQRRCPQVEKIEGMMVTMKAVVIVPRGDLKKGRVDLRYRRHR